LAVQGRQIPELIDHWLADPYFKRLPPRWHPLGCRHDREMDETVQMAVDAGWSVRDLLCTACHFIAETIRWMVDDRLPKTPTIDQIVLTGGGQQNGMLLRGISARLDKFEIVRASRLGVADEVLDPAAAALLAALHLDQVPANHTALTGTETPRILGRLTPGSPQAWHRTLQHMAENRPAVMSLRRAI